MGQTRYIPPLDPTKPVGQQIMDRFKVGDRVSHVQWGDGLVVRIVFQLNKEEFIHCLFVQYDNGPEERYDASWFEKYPRYLFHRNTNELIYFLWEN